MTMTFPGKHMLNVFTLTLLCTLQLPHVQPFTLSVDKGLVRNAPLTFTSKGSLPRVILSRERNGLRSLRASSNDNDDQPPPLPNTDDPFLILGLKTPTADTRQIKRAYKRRALQYHPDVRCSASSTDEEKKKANDDFARINSAYAFLSGKEKDASSSSSSKSASAENRGGYTPPHRRTADKGYSNRKTDVDWQDFMPKYDDKDYDAGGDSFGAIFNDFVKEVSSSSVSGGGGVLNDLISFLEGNFPSVSPNNMGSGQGGEKDLILESLLRTGSMEDIKNELDDANLLSKQLDRKDSDLTKEYEEVLSEIASLSSSKTFMEEMGLEERRREIEARREVVREYLDRSRERQGKLRRRYKELLLKNDGSDDRSSSDESSSGRKRRDSRGDGSEHVGYDKTNPSKSPSKDSVDGTTKGKEWDAKDSFGSSGRRRRGRGSRRNRYGSTSNPNSSSAPSENSRTPYTTSSSERKSPDQQNREPASTTSTSYVPPHRRILDRSSRAARNADDKRRLREIKVEEDLEKMKRELGL
jgi:curved DNA-binding protein CbpA